MNTTSASVSSQNIHISPQSATGFFTVLVATVRKDLWMAFRYRANLIGNVIRSVLFIVVFYLFALAYVFDNSNYTDSQMLLFFMTGFLFVIYDGAALWGPMNTVNSDLYNGTLEYIYSCPSNRIAYFLGTSVSQAVIASIMNIPILALFVFCYRISPVSMFMVLLSLVMLISVITAFGTMFALSVIMWKQVNSLAGIFNAVFQFLSGFLFPVSVLPPPAKAIAYALPYTWGIDLIRVYAFGAEWTPLLPIPVMWAILALYLVLYWALAAYLVNKVEEYSKKKGLHLL